MKRIVVLTAVIGTALALTATASAGLPGPHARAERVAPVVFTTQTGRVVTHCSRPIPGSWQVAVWVSVNGRDIHSGDNSGTIMYYAGQGTMVKLRLYTGDAPVCVRVITWLPTATVRVRFRVL